MFSTNPKSDRILAINELKHLRPILPKAPKFCPVSNILYQFLGFPVGIYNTYLAPSFPKLELEMACRNERCNGCGRQLLVPSEAQIIRCDACEGITRISRSSVNPLIRAGQDTINHTVNRVKSRMTRVMSMPSPNAARPANPQYYQHQLSQPFVPKPLMPPSAYGRKRAVLCGVSYNGKSYKLKGTVNDVHCMKYFLVDRLGFPNHSVLLLTEHETDPFRIPTKQNMRMALQWLVQGCQSGDSLVFYFSGHGSTQPDYSMDEIDGIDETVCPVDFETEGMIIDDEINATIVRPLPHGAKLHAIIDACHSGTVLDLRFLCRINREGHYVWEDHQFSPTYKGTSGGIAVSISSCDDHQKSADTTALSGDTSTGALTYSFIQAADNNRGSTYGFLLNAMRHKIREAKTGVEMEPQLTSSERFDIYSTPMVL
ncbi:hypothetical protein EV1_002690 [Malus domestica]|uniref:Peptidase C14 caspase domain-containing protein n=1 Tax=Malus domestica TaxID=3750 RepID=A0A498IXS7_MALDO|nr:metacaspase-1-like isoform X1 [Malus domestica]XP_028965312.1 metacaspase-1-like isoform X1 [Malus domestica]RXH87906.1 hypothetical protein DVH24_037551 [Malus domestica]